MVNLVGPVGEIPNIFSNQQLINAFFQAAKEGNVDPNSLFRRAGLQIEALAADDQTRAKPYAGKPISQFVDLSQSETTEIKLSLIRELMKGPFWRGAVDSEFGLNLRSHANSQSTVLVMLEDQLALSVLNQAGDWLFICTDEGQIGYVHSNFVRKNEDHTPPDLQPTTKLMGGLASGSLSPESNRVPSGSPLHGFLSAEPELAHIRLAAPTDEAIFIQPTFGPGATRIAQVWNRYGGLLKALSHRLAIDWTGAVAVLTVESGGQGFQDKQLIIRFENHLFYDDWGREQQKRFFRHFRFNPEESWKDHNWRESESVSFESFHGTQSKEWAVLNHAIALKPDAAIRSISMGASQILGRNHQRIGYPSVQQMFDAFRANESNHITGLFDFIRTDPDLLSALREKNYVAFARKYNGQGQAQVYGDLIRQNEEALIQVRAASASRSVGSQLGQPLDVQLDNAIAEPPKLELPDVKVKVVL